MEVTRRLAVFGILVSGVFGPDSDTLPLSVKEGDSVTLKTDAELSQQDRIKWYFNNILIARIYGDLSQICTDVQCDEGAESFRGRLKLDHQTGSLTIINTIITDSGDYRRWINSRDKIFNVSVTCAPGVDSDRSVMEGDSVTLHTDVKIKKEDRIRWYFNTFRISQIINGQIQICTDEQCKEQFKDRLNLNNQTGSLTINNIRNEDSGEYKLQINSGGRSSEKSYNITVVVSAAEREQMKSVKEGDPVILYTGVMKKPNDELRWTFTDIVIAELTGDESQICSDGQCKMRFEDRLKLDHQTGSLNITNTRSTDSGVYKLEITRSGFGFRRRRSVSITSVKSFSVSVTDSGLSSSAVGGIVVAVLLAAVIAAGLIYKNCVRKQQHPPIEYSRGSVIQRAESNEDDVP